MCRGWAGDRTAGPGLESGARDAQLPADTNHRQPLSSTGGEIAPGELVRGGAPDPQYSSGLLDREEVWGTLDGGGVIEISPHNTQPPFQTARALQISWR